MRPRPLEGPPALEAPRLRPAGPRLGFTPLEHQPTNVAGFHGKAVLVPDTASGRAYVRAFEHAGTLVRQAGGTVHGVCGSLARGTGRLGVFDTTRWSYDAAAILDHFPAKEETSQAGFKSLLSALLGDSRTLPLLISALQRLHHHDRPSDLDIEVSGIAEETMVAIAKQIFAAHGVLVELGTSAMTPGHDAKDPLGTSLIAVPGHGSE